MADIPSVTPTAPATPVTGSNTPQLSGAPVQQTPDTVTPPAQLTGIVVSSNPQTQQLNIQTPQGQVVVQSAVSLPPDTPVLIDLYTANAQTRATVTVIRQNAAQVQMLENLIQPDVQTTPAPPLQEGSTVTALQLQQPAAQAPLQIEQLAASIETLKETGLQNFQLPLPQQLLQELLTTSDIKAFLKQLPPQLLQNVANYFAAQKQPPADEHSPGILKRLLSAYLPQKSPEAASLPPIAENDLPDVFDNNLLHIMQTQLQAKATQQNIQSPPAPGNTKPAAFSPLITTLDALFSSSEETSQKTSGFSALLRQLIPQGIPKSTPAPQNMFELHILKILPPGTTPEQIKSIMH